MKLIQNLHTKTIVTLTRYDCKLRKEKRGEYNHTYTSIHLSSLPHNASPTLTTPLNGFVTIRTTAFPG